MPALLAPACLSRRHEYARDMDFRTRKPPRHLLSGFHTRNVLAHLKREGGAYFVTFRLAGTLPAQLIQKLKRERELILQQALVAKRPLTWHEQEELFRWYSRRVDAHLDAGHGDCFLKRPEIAELVVGAVKFFEGRRYELRVWVVMPNHVHVVVRPKAVWTWTDILHSWKSYTANQANKILDRTGNSFWQEESYDHLVRDDEDMARCCHYTTMNPVNAQLCSRREDWKWSSAYHPAPPPGP